MDVISQTYPARLSYNTQTILGELIVAHADLNSNCMLTSFSKEYVPPVHSDPLTEQEKLLAMCRQTQPIALTNFFTET